MVQNLPKRFENSLGAFKIEKCDDDSFLLLKKMTIIGNPHPAFYPIIRWNGLMWGWITVKRYNLSKTQ